MSRDLVHLMRISAEINKLIKYINPSYRSKSFSTIPSGLKTIYRSRLNFYFIKFF
jgi:hypothetical protein